MYGFLLLQQTYEKRRFKLTPPLNKGGVLTFSFQFEMNN